jgi:hypothetical protein
MEPESSLPYSQVPTTSPYPEPTPSSPYNPLPLPEDHLNIILPSTSGSPQWFLSLRFPLCTPFPSPIRATCPAYLILLNFTTRTILGKEYRSLSSSLYNFLHPPKPITDSNGEHPASHYLKEEAMTPTWESTKQLTAFPLRSITDTNYEDWIYYTGC